MGRKTGSIITYGRAWLGNFGWEWKLWSKDFGIQLGLADYEHALSGYMQAFLFSFFWHYEHHRLYSWLQRKIKRSDERYGNGRTIGIRIFDGRIWFDLWNDPMEHRHDDPGWWHFSWCPVDFLFGYPHYSEKRLSTHRVEIPMPECAYPATVDILEASWKRSRWPWPKKMLRADIKPDIPIPHPGKGENSWDCGEDATYSMTCPAETPHDAVMAITGSIMKRRQRYGGIGWRPEDDGA